MGSLAATLASKPYIQKTNNKSLKAISIGAEVFVKEQLKLDELAK